MRRAEVIAARLGERQELGRQDCAHHVRPLIHAVGVAEAIAEEPCHGVGAARLQLGALRFLL